MARIPPPVLDAARPRSGHPRRQLIPILLATGATLPAIATRVSGSAPPEWLAAAIFGIGVIGAAFLLAWGAEALQLDISQGSRWPSSRSSPSCPSTQSTSRSR